MIITLDFLLKGATPNGEYKQEQIELLDIEWPLTLGWQTKVIGKKIPEETAKEFIRIANGGTIPEGMSEFKPDNWFNSKVAVDIYLYTLALANDCYYVGLTSNVKRRMEEHSTGKGAEWTKINKPLRVIQAINTGTKDARKAEKMENDATVAMMRKYGISKVRGGYFVEVNESALEMQLRAHGEWIPLKLNELRKKDYKQDLEWECALSNFLDAALDYYDKGAPAHMHDRILEKLESLTRQSSWHKDFEPCLKWEFWNIKGVLPVLLSFKHSRAIGSKVPSAYHVLASAVNRGKKDNYPLRRLYLLGWKGLPSSTTEKQAETVNRFMAYLDEKVEYDRQYDAFSSVLFPEIKALLQNEEEQCIT